MMQTRYEFPNGGYLIDKTGSVNDYNMQTGNKLEEGDYVTTGTFFFFFFPNKTVRFNSNKCNG